jgi:ketosteroid isomerase-like protein
MTGAAVRAEVGDMYSRFCGTAYWPQMQYGAYDLRRERSRMARILGHMHRPPAVGTPSGAAIPWAQERVMAVTALAIAQAYAEAWVSGDAQALIGLYADDIVLHYFGESPLAGEHRGKPAALAALAQVSARTKRGKPEIHDVLASDTHAAILAKEAWMDGDTPVSVNRLLLYHVRDGKFTECWIYDEDQRFVDAMFSREPAP